MKKSIFLLLTAIVLWSCQNATFTIKGTVVDPAFEGTNVYLQERTDDGLQTVETAVVQNGTFTFTGMADENALRYVSLDERNVCVLLERGIINVVFGDVISVSGTKINTAFNEFRLRHDELYPRRGFLEEWRELQDLTLTFIRNNIDNEIGRSVLRTSINRFYVTTQGELLELTDDCFRAEPNMARIMASVENARNVAIGNRFIDFTMNDPEGNEVSLSDFAGQGNYVLVVFWATWCGPCMTDIPRYIELYAKYKSKGFEIVGVSLDADHSAWVAGIERLGITWPQMSDLRVWDSPVREKYAFRAIPHTILLDREGIIIDRHLFGERLNERLAELMP